MSRYLKRNRLTCSCSSMSVLHTQRNSERTQQELATELSAVLAFSAMGNNDKVGAIFFTDRVEKFIAPEKEKSRATHCEGSARHETRGNQRRGPRTLHFSAAMKADRCVLDFGLQVCAATWNSKPCSSAWADDTTWSLCTWTIR